MAKSNAKRHGGKRTGAGRKGAGRWERLISVVKADLAAIGASDSPKNVRAVIHDRRVADPSFYAGVKESTLPRNYFRYRNRPTPIAEPPRSRQPSERRDVWISKLETWDSSPQASRAVMDRLIALVTDKMPFLGLDYIDAMFDHVTRARKYRTGRMKLEWFHHHVDGLDNERPRFLTTLSPLQRRLEADIHLIESAFRDGLTGLPEIAAQTGLAYERTQEVLSFMIRPGVDKAAHLSHGHYGPKRDGLGNHVRTGEQILKIFAEGPASPKQIRDRTGLDEAKVTGALDWLCRRTRKIIRLKRGLYALSGHGRRPGTQSSLILSQGHNQV